MVNSTDIGVKNSVSESQFCHLIVGDLGQIPKLF